MTGWRIGEMLALRWDAVDLKHGTMKLDSEDTKGNRDAVVALHPLVIEHLEAMRSRSVQCLPWRSSSKTLYRHLGIICDKAGVQTTGFHDLRRSFATMNQGLPAPVLQQLMRHKAFATTLKYIDAAKRANPAVENLSVPPIRKRKNGA